MDWDALALLCLQPQENAIEEILHSNEASGQFGLLLTREQAGLLLQSRREALRKCGRIEFGGGVIGKLAAAFCDSPYLSPDCYAQTLQHLQELFYTFKNETLDLIADDKLIGQMAYYFNTSCEGSLELLESRELDRLAHDLRFGATRFASHKEFTQNPLYWEDDYDE